MGKDDQRPETGQPLLTDKERHEVLTVTKSELDESVDEHQMLFDLVPCSSGASWSLFPSEGRSTRITGKSTWIRSTQNL